MEIFFLLVGILAILFVWVVILHIKQSYDVATAESFQTVSTTPGLLTLKPTLWWFVDDDTNARSWWDFGARNSRLPNRGYTQVALEAVYATQSFDFQVVPLIGRKAVADVIMQAGETLPASLDQLPATLWRAWAFSALLATKGGLVMVGDSTLCIGPSFSTVTRDVDSAVFGITTEEARAIPGANVAPASWVGWGARPHMPIWDIAATTWSRVVSAGPTAWSAAEARRISEKIWATQALKQPARFQVAEGSRKADGTEVTPEDLLQKLTFPTDPKVLFSPKTLYVVMDGDALVREYRYSWFVRMSKEQILSSHFYWAKLAKEHLPRLYKTA